MAFELWIFYFLVIFGSVYLQEVDRNAMMLPCDKPARIANAKKPKCGSGGLDQRGPFIVGVVCQHLCLDGYKPNSEENRVTCNVFGNWIGSPTCTAGSTVQSPTTKVFFRAISPSDKVTESMTFQETRSNVGSTVPSQTTAVPLQTLSSPDEVTESTTFQETQSTVGSTVPSQTTAVPLQTLSQPGKVTKSTTFQETWSPVGSTVPSQTKSVSLQPMAQSALCYRERLKNLTFPPVHIEETSYSEEKCKGSGVSRGAVRCRLDVMARSASVIGNFDSRTFVKIECNDTIDDVIAKALSKSESASATMEMLQVLTSNPANTSVKNILLISEFLEKLRSSEEQISDNVVASNIEIVSHLSQSLRANTNGTDSSNVDKAKQSLVKSVFAISRKLNTTQTRFSAVSEEISFKLLDFPGTKPGSVTFDDVFYGFNGSDNAIRPVTITLPAEVFVAAQNKLIQSGNFSSTLRIVTVAYRDSSLFPSKDKANWLVACEIGDHEKSVNVSSLQDRVEIIYHGVKEYRSKQELSQFKMKLTRLKCVFWDFEKEDWSQDGCCLVPEDPPRCLCNHLTNFAVLVSKEDVSADVALSVVSFIGCSLSVLGFFLTFLVLASVKSLRNSKPMQVEMHICACMGFSFIVFMAGVDKTGSPVGCSVITAILQYGFLASWFWMVVYSHMLYRSTVKVMQSVGTHYSLWKASLLAYILPLVIVIFNAGLTLGYFDKNRPTTVCGERDEFAESFYNAPNFCWLQDYSLYFGFLLPVGLFLIFNVVVFIQVLKKIAFKKKEIRSTAPSRSTRQHLMIAILMATMMGLSWLTGYFMLLSDNMMYLTAMSWFFSGINSLQGVLVFVFTCVRTGELQKLVREKLSEVRERSRTKSTTMGSVNRNDTA